MHQVPDGLAALVEHYRGKAQAALPFYPRTWEQAVDDIRPRSTGALLHAAGQDVDAGLAGTPPHSG